MGSDHLALPRQLPTDPRAVSALIQEEPGLSRDIRGNIVRTGQSWVRQGVTWSLFIQEDHAYNSAARRHIAPWTNELYYDAISGRFMLRFIS